MRIIKKKFSIALCLMLAIAMCSLSIVNTAALSMLSADVADNSDLKTKIGYIDFSYCYKSKTLGEDVKQDLKNVEKYIKQTKKYSLSDLNKLIKKADKVSFNTYSTSKGTDYSKYLPTSKVQLNSYEKKVFNSNPMVWLYWFRRIMRINKKKIDLVQILWEQMGMLFDMHCGMRWVHAEQV